MYVHSFFFFFFLEGQLTAVTWETCPGICFVRTCVLLRMIYIYIYSIGGCVYCVLFSWNRRPRDLCFFRETKIVIVFSSSKMRFDLGYFMWPTCLDYGRGRFRNVSNLSSPLSKSVFFFFKRLSPPPLQVCFEILHYCVIPFPAPLECHVSPPREENNKKTHHSHYCLNSTGNDTRFVLTPNTWLNQHDWPVFLCPVRPSNWQTYFFTDNYRFSYVCTEITAVYV